MIPHRLWLGLILFVLLAACTSTAPNNDPQPPEINYGLDICDSCGMLIDDPTFAAATLLQNGESRKFDDIGDMFTYHMDHPDLQVEAYFVHDYHTQNWLRGEGAFYVMADTIDSPMGHGIAAFELQSEAEAMAKEAGSDLLTFEQLRVAVHTTIHN